MMHTKNNLKDLCKVYIMVIEIQEKDGWKSLVDFISDHRVEKGADFTHTNLSHAPFSFYVPIDKLDTFYSLYENYIKKANNVYITERNRHIGPILVDLDFKFDICKEEIRQYDIATIKAISKKYSDVVSKYFDITDEDDIYIMEKTKPYLSKTCQKDGIHLVMPSLVTKASVKYMVRDEIIKDNEFLSEIKTLNNINDIIDDSVIERNSWYMYGSKKKQNEPYLVTYKYNIKSNKLTSVLEKNDLKFIKMFSIRNKYKERKIGKNKMAEVEQYEKSRTEALEKKRINKKIITSCKNSKQVECNDIAFVKELVEILKHSRADSYNDWIRLGWCLRNIDHRLEKVWEDFSAKSSKYVKGECSRIWNRMRSSGLEIGTLHMWAKEDNIGKYNDIIGKHLSSAIYASRSKAHNDVARVIHLMYKHIFVCGSSKGRYWYEFKNHKWCLSESGIALRSKLSHEVWGAYKREGIKWNTRALECYDDDERKKLEEVGGILNDIALKLRNTTFKENVMKECAELFYVEKFEEKLDSNPSIIGFENGVYDLEEHEFRDGTPEDYISFSTNIDYIPYDDDHEHTRAIKRYLEQVLSNEKVRNYVLKLFATFISGNIKEQKFYIWTGSGSNSKSKLVELFEKSLGDYCCKFPITLLTQKRVASNAANGELARAKGKRFACLQEPSEDEKINIGLMKELSGGDKIMARALYKEPFEFSPQFKMLLLCNHLPHVPSDDGGTWRRIRVVEFTSKFVENPVEQNEYPIDYELSDKMNDWNEHFMSMLIHYYKIYQEEGIAEPQDVLKCTTNYKLQNDHMSAFVSNKLEKKDTGFLSLDEAHSELRSWIKDDCIPMKLPSKPDLERYMSKHIGKLVVFSKIKGYKGYRLKTWDVEE